MQNTIYKLCWGCLACLLFCMGCQEDKDLMTENGSGSSLEVSGGYKYSSFTLSNKALKLNDAVHACDVLLRSMSSGDTLSFPVTIGILAEQIRLRMQIPENLRLVDSDYELRLRYPGGKLGKICFKLAFKDEMMHLLLAEKFEYVDLEGTGTAEDPYQIGSSFDFSSFLISLSEDPAYAAGVYFKQTTDLELPKEGQTDGRGYGRSYPFAGCYDGGSHVLSNLLYKGANNETKDAKVGLFSELLDGASILNVSLKNADLRQVVGECGLLAGAATGSVQVKNVSVYGQVAGSGNDLGGLIGSLTNANLSVSGCKYAAHIYGEESVGGLIGKAVSSSIHISDTHTDGMFSVSAKVGKAGGVVGSAIETNLDLSDVSLDYTVTTEDNDIRILQSAGNHVGGIVGYMESIKPLENRFYQVSVNCPVYAGDSYAGGFIGRNVGHSVNEFSSSFFSSLLEGHSYVGGLIGYSEAKMKLSLVRVAQLSEGVSVIKGGTYVGGFAGMQVGDIELMNRNFMLVRITATEECVGGLTGYLENGICNEKGYFRTDADVEIVGKKNVGGMIGALVKGTIKGGQTEWLVKDLTSIPSADSFKATFEGKVGKRDGSSVNVGGIVGYCEGSKISDFCVGGTTQGLLAGGIVGFGTSGSVLTNCVNRSLLYIGSADGKDCVLGGIAGHWQNSEIQTSINYSSFDKEVKSAGGIVGHFEHKDGSTSFFVESCVNMGNIIGLKHIGGIIGLADGRGQKDVLQCANYGIVTGMNTSGKESDLSGVGGIVGVVDLHSMVAGCANKGDVLNKGPYHGVGGIAGTLGKDADGGATSNCDNYAYVESCCNFGSVNAGHTNTRLGGIVGYMEEGCNHDYDRTKISDCYNAGPVNSSNLNMISDPGGILGLLSSYGKCRNTLNRGVVNKGNGGIGTTQGGGIYFWEYLYFESGTSKSWHSIELSLSQVKQQSSYKGFDFNNVWLIETGVGYPYLRNCKFQFVGN